VTSDEPRRRFGLRARITLAFGLGALLLSTLLAAMTWGATRENLLRQRDDIAKDRVILDAQSIQASLGPEVNLQQLLLSIPTPEGGQPVLLAEGEWHSTNPLRFDQDSLPIELRERVVAGEGAFIQRYQLDGEPYVAVGVPIPTRQAAYFEGLPLTDLQTTLDELAVALAGAAAVTTLAGSFLGFSATRRLVRPVGEVGRAAEAIAGGALATRLNVGGDPDLLTLERSFNEMVTALEQRIERDARFASDVSHELRSPLTTLEASVQVLENQRAVMPERARTALDLLTEDISRFRTLVEDLLEISRVDAGAVTLDLSEVLASEMVQRAVAASVRPTTPIAIDDDATRCTVLVDKRRMARVIANLIENAEKYAGGATRVHVSCTPEEVRLAVEDGGHGVPEDERAIVFDRFARGRTAGARGSDTGTGLGLSLVDEHVRLHGGRVWVEDRPDYRPGARFVVALPLAEPDAADGLEDLA
jgi:signal transduction histidine kinase